MALFTSEICGDTCTPLMRIRARNAGEPIVGHLHAAWIDPEPHVLVCQRWRRRHESIDMFEDVAGVDGDGLPVRSADEGPGCAAGVD